MRIASQPSLFVDPFGRLDRVACKNVRFPRFARRRRKRRFIRPGFAIGIVTHGGHGGGSFAAGGRRSWGAFGVRFRNEG